MMAAMSARSAAPDLSRGIKMTISRRKASSASSGGGGGGVGGEEASAWTDGRDATSPNLASRAAARIRRRLASMSDGEPWLEAVQVFGHFPQGDEGDVAAVPPVQVGQNGLDAPEVAGCAEALGMIFEHEKGGTIVSAQGPGDDPVQEAAKHHLPDFVDAGEVEDEIALGSGGAEPGGHHSRRRGGQRRRGRLRGTDQASPQGVSYLDGQGGGALDRRQGEALGGNLHNGRGLGGRPPDVGGIGVIGSVGRGEATVVQADVFPGKTQAVDDGHVDADAVAFQAAQDGRAGTARPPGAGAKGHRGRGMACVAQIAHGPVKSLLDLLVVVLGQVPTAVQPPPPRLPGGVEPLRVQVQGHVEAVGEHAGHGPAPQLPSPGQSGGGVGETFEGELLQGFHTEGGRDAVADIKIHEGHRRQILEGFHLALAVAAQFPVVGEGYPDRFHGVSSVRADRRSSRGGPGKGLPAPSHQGMTFDATPVKDYFPRRRRRFSRAASPGCV